MTHHTHRPRESGTGARQVLIPGTTKQAPHPWRERLRATMDGKPTTKTTPTQAAS